MFTPTNNQKIIIADDRGDQRDLVRDMIETLFGLYSFEFCKNGNELKSRLEKGVSDVECILTDNDMGDGPTGSQLIAEYARKKEYPPMILIYGGQDEIGEDAIKNGAAACLKKPYNTQQFKEVVGLALRRAS